jgi:hypothetical protein
MNRFENSSSVGGCAWPWSARYRSRSSPQRFAPDLDWTGDFTRSRWRVPSGSRHTDIHLEEPPLLLVLTLTSSSFAFLRRRRTPGATPWQVDRTPDQTTTWANGPRQLPASMHRVDAAPVSPQVDRVVRSPPVDLAAGESWRVVRGLELSVTDFYNRVTMHAHLPFAR